MTPDLLNALADVLDALGALRDSGILDVDFSDQTDEALDALGATGDAVSVALGIEADTTWQETATALRLHADKTDAATNAATNAALLATITAAHDGDLAAASEAASLAFGLLGLDGVFRVRVENATTLTPGLPGGWKESPPTNFGEGISYPAHGPAGAYVLLHVYSDGQTWWGQSGYATAAVYAYLLARAGVGS